MNTRNTTIINQNAMRRLNACRHDLSRQQFKTLKGQIIAGEDEAAMKGLEKLLMQRKAQ